MLSTNIHPSQSISNTNNLITNINNNKEKRKIGSTYLQKKFITNTVRFHRNSYFQTQDDNIYTLPISIATGNQKTIGKTIYYIIKQLVIIITFLALYKIIRSIPDIVKKLIVLNFKNINNNKITDNKYISIQRISTYKNILPVNTLENN